jgi:hypothetical protein
MAFFASNFDNKALMARYDTSNVPIVKDQLRKMTDGFFKKVDLTIDRRTMEKILGIYFASVDSIYFPGLYNTIEDRFKGDINDYVEWLFQKSVFTNPGKLNRIIDNLSTRSVNKLLSDPASLFYRSFSEALVSYYPVADSLDRVLQRLYRDYLQGLMSTDTNRVYYPDANFTMRVTFGKVEGYKAADAITYDYHTTATGILEKEDPDIADYRVDEKLRHMIENKDFGRYGQNNTLPVCFIASNHTSGGNSGSPVLDKEGRLIGINFDRNWEGTVSDFDYDPAVCRNISLDIRYVLFLIDKYAEASNLMQELTIE